MEGTVKAITTTIRSTERNKMHEAMKWIRMAI